MRTVRLGGSGLDVSRLGLGTLEWGGRVDEYVAQDLLTAFLDAGGSLIDTAPLHSDGQGEPLLGRLLAKSGLRDRVVLAGKAGMARRDDRIVRDGSRRTLLAQLEQSLRDLGTDHLDLWQVHQWDGSTPIEETMATLDDAVRRGLVRYAGISNFSGWQTSLAYSRFQAMGGGVPLVSTQVEYSLVHRGAEAEVVPAAKHLGMSVIAWAPLGRGVLSGKYRAGVGVDSRAAHDRWAPYVAPHLEPRPRRTVEAVCKAADGLGASPVHVALAWLRERPAVATLVLGPRTVIQLQQSLGSESLTLPPEIHEALTDVSEGAP